MPNIQPINTISIEKELSNLELYKYHPNGILNISLNRLIDMLDGKIDIVDPSNPFTYLLETSCLNTAFAIQEYTLLTRKLYPRLANNYNDLFLHMSDFDYLGIFAEPAYGNVIFNILLNDFETRAKYDPVQNEYVLKLPRHLKVTVDKYIFTLPSAIIIRKTENGIFDVKFENQNFNNIFPVETNYIDFYLYKVNAEETYITFKVKLPEIDIEAVEIPLEKSKLFKNTLTYNPSRDFYFFRAFYRKNNEWKEMLVTHTEEIYDIYNPTCIIKINTTEHTIDYFIPSIYINSNQIETKVKFLIYTTNGPIDVNFNNYTISSFNNEYNPVFPEEELDDTTEPLQLITKVIYLADKVVGGKNSLDFNSLKNAVIDNSIGDRKLPITNKQLEFFIEQNNFKLIKDVDTVTNRIFLLSTQLPSPLTRYPVTRLNFDIIEYKTTINKLKLNGNNIIDINSHVTIIPENTIFVLEENELKILSGIEQTNLQSLSDINLVNELNSKKYLATFYHYILTSYNDKVELRAYDLNNTEISNINFKEFNSTTRVSINTSNIAIAKTPNGYTINVLTNLKKYVNSINETNIKPYLVYTDINDSKYYIEGNLFTNINNNPVYKFLLDTNYFIDNNNKIYISNFRDINNNLATIGIDLESKLEIIYVSNIVPPNFIPSSIDSYIYGSYIAVNSCVVTLEEVKIKFADYLEYLDTRIHTSVGDQPYETYDEDIPLKYTSNVYDSNNNIIHYVNEIVLDENNNPIIQHHKGEIKYDENNNPIPIPIQDYNVYMNLFFIDYRAIVANTEDIINYRKYLRSFITEKIVENAKNVQEVLLENTIAYVTLPKSIENVIVKVNNKIASVYGLQNLQIDLCVKENVYNDTSIRDNIEYAIIKQVDEYFFNRKIISKSELHELLFTNLKEYVENITIRNFTNIDVDYIEIINNNSYIGLNKKLVLENNKYNLKEDITIKFLKI